jgi:hypothetical protein
MLEIPVLRSIKTIVQIAVIPALVVPGGTRGGDSGLTTSQGLGLPSFSGSSSLSLGSFSGSSGGFSSGGLFADAGQQTAQGKVTPGNPTFAAGSAFAGSIHLVTAEQQYSMNNVQLNATERAKVGAMNYYSIGTGAAPTGQVVTDAQTGTSPTPTTMSVTRFDAHVVKLDQYGVPDPATDSAGLSSNIGITGLAGAEPTGPAVVGTAPLVDERANFNRNATFALGEFRVSVGADGTPTFSVRRSDQDRLIVKDLNGNDAEDLVTPNTDVTFEDTVDARFLPQSPTVKTPVADAALNSRGTTYSELNFMRRSAFTNVVADTLQDYSRRTGQTRFVVDGKIVDISGYQPGH